MRKRFVHGSVFATALLLTSLSHAEEFSEPPKAIVRYCSACHGLETNSQLPYVPRLAGVNALYLDSRFARYKATARSPVDQAFQALLRPGGRNGHSVLTGAAMAEMVGVAHVVPEKDARAAIAWYASRETGAPRSSPRKTAGAGQRLYAEGLEEKGICACRMCHGPGAQGTRAAPRLAGQNADYLFGQLVLFRSGERRDASMTDVARRLADDEARAVAYYLQSQ
jgi:cytochrome c553